MFGVRAVNGLPVLYLSRCTGLPTMYAVQVVSAIGALALGLVLWQADDMETRTLDRP